MAEFIGGASGAILGYITGNTHGARTGFNLGRNAGRRFNQNKQTMAPLPRKRSVSTHPNAVSKKRAAFFNTVSNPRRTVLFKRPVRNVRGISLRRKFRRSKSSLSGSNQNAVDRSRKGSKVAREGRKRTVRVPGRLRKQIKQVVHGTDPLGIYEEIYYDPPIYFADNVQAVQQQGLASGSVQTQLLFNPLSVLNAASVLWNRKAPAQTKLFTQAGNFPAETFRCYVEDQWVQFTYHNNTGRTITMKLWDASLKSNWPQSSIAGNVVYDGVALTWANHLAQNSPSGATDAEYSNVLSNTVTTLYNSPKFVQAMNNNFTMDCTTVILQPGKEYKHIVKGPKNKMYDFQKYFIGSDTQTGSINFVDGQKFTKEHFVVAYFDLSNTSLSTPGRSTDIVTNSGYSLLCESRSFYRLRLPEMAGAQVTTPAAGTTSNVPLSNRTYRHAITNWAIAQSGTVVYIEDENPLAQAAAAIV